MIRIFRSLFSYYLCARSSSPLSFDILFVDFAIVSFYFFFLLLLLWTPLKIDIVFFFCYLSFCFRWCFFQTLNVICVVFLFTCFEMKTNWTLFSNSLVKWMKISRHWSIICLKYLMGSAFMRFIWKMKNIRLSWVDAIRQMVK